MIVSRLMLPRLSVITMLTVKVSPVTPPIRKKTTTWPRMTLSLIVQVTDEDATFDKEVHLEAADIGPHVSWGTNPAQVVPLVGSIPSPDVVMSAIGTKRTLGMDHPNDNAQNP